MADLTTLAAVKAYLGISVATQDAVISSLIPRESRLIEGWTGRIFPTETQTSTRLNGSGSGILVLPSFPLLALTALFVDETAVPASSDGVQAGYILGGVDGNVVKLLPEGSRFTRGSLNVKASWTSGYRTTESAFVPTGNTPTLTPTTGGTAISSNGVTYTGNGSALTLVGNAPAVSQFSYAAGTYTFNSADYNHQVTMNYDYVPGPVEQACIEMVGLDLKQRDNLGVNSKTLAGETVSYTSKGMTDSVKEMLQPYKRMSPL